MKGLISMASAILLAASIGVAVSLPAYAQDKPPATDTSAPAPAAKKHSKAYLARLHACAAEWKTMKAEGKRPEGTKWPQFWHECDQRKKSEGM